MNKIKIFRQKQNYDKTLTSWDTRQGSRPLRDSTFSVFVIPVLNVLPRVLALSCAVRNKGEVFPLPSLPSPSSLARCHLSQSERPWQFAKFPVSYFTPCCRKGSRQALRSDFTPLPKAPTLGELDAVRRPERARMLTARLHPGLDDAYDGADFRKARSKLTRCVLVSGLALSVIACAMPPLPK